MPKQIFLSFVVEIEKLMYSRFVSCPITGNNNKTRLFLGQRGNYKTYIYVRVYFIPFVIR